MSQTTIDELRSEIHDINNEIIELIAERTEVAAQIGKEKQKQNKAIHQPAQEKRVLSICSTKAKKEGLEAAAVMKIFKIIIGISREAQDQSQHMRSCS